MPVMPTRSLKSLARLTASWPVSASATSRISCGLGGGLDVGHLDHQRLVDMRTAGGVEDDDVVAAERAASTARRAISPAFWPATIGSVSMPFCSPSWRELLLRGGTAHVERGHQHLALLRRVRRLAILAEVVVLPEPCRPTIMMATGAAAR
jgi:hypothetical protein